MAETLKQLMEEGRARDRAEREARVARQAAERETEREARVARRAAEREARLTTNESVPPGGVVTLEHLLLRLRAYPDEDKIVQACAAAIGEYPRVVSVGRGTGYAWREEQVSPIAAAFRRYRARPRPPGGRERSRSLESEWERYRRNLDNKPEQERLRREARRSRV